MSIPHYSLFPHSRHVDVMQTAYQPQGKPDYVLASAVTKQQPPNKMQTLSIITSSVMSPATTIGTFSRHSSHRPDAQALPSEDLVLPTMATPSPSRPRPQHHKSKSAPNVRSSPLHQASPSPDSNPGLESPEIPSSLPLTRRKTMAHKKSDIGLVLNATPALEPLPPWSPYYCSNPDAETPTRRARNSTLPNDKRSFGARAVAAGMVPPSLDLNDKHRACDSSIVELTSPYTPVTKQKRGLFSKSRSFGMLRRSTISNDDQNNASTVPVPPLPVTPHYLSLPTPASPMTMSYAVDRAERNLLNDIITPARHRPHLDLSTSPPPLISPSSSDAWSPTSVSPSSPKPAFLNQKTYFLSSPRIPPRQSSKRVLPSSPALDERLYFTATSAEPSNIDSGRDLASSLSLSLRTTTPDVDSRSFDSRMLYGASPSASLASVASTPRSRGRTNSHSASGQLRSPRKQKLPGRLDMPLPPLPHSLPTCLPPSRPIPPVPVLATTQRVESCSETLDLPSMSTPASCPHALIRTPTPTPFTSTPINHSLRRAASDTPAPAPTLQSYWDIDADSVVDTPRPRPSSMPLWRKVKAGLHLAKRSWEKGMSAGSSANGSGSGSGSVRESSVSEEEWGRDGTRKRSGREEAGAWFF